MTNTKSIELKETTSPQNIENNINTLWSVVNEHMEYAYKDSLRANESTAYNNCEFYSMRAKTNMKMVETALNNIKFLQEYSVSSI